LPAPKEKSPARARKPTTKAAKVHTPQSTAKQTAPATKPVYLSGAFGGMASGNVVQVGTATFRLQELVPGPAPADDGSLSAWIQRNGSQLKCGLFGGHATCLTPNRHDLSFALVFNGLATPTDGAYREIHLAYGALQLRAAALASGDAKLIQRLLAGNLAPSCHFIFTCGREMSSKGYVTEQLQFAQQDWASLVHTVMDIDYKFDLNYYYLGRAAEAFGAVQAARAYYIKAAVLYMSTSSDDHCRGHSAPFCGGMDMQTEIQSHLDAMNALIPYVFDSSR
jgi:hypothetical protein